MVSGNKQRFAAVLTVVALVWPCLASASEIRTVVTRFSGQESLATSVAAVLNLQLWRTLRRAPTPNPKRLDFGTATILWYAEPLDSPDHLSAERAAKTPKFLAQHALWGSVHSFGKTAVLTAYLALPSYFDFRSEKKEVWTLVLNGGPTLTADVPQRYYAFEAIKLSAPFVTKYTTPDVLLIKEGRGTGRIIGPLGREFKHLESRGEFAKVRNAQGKIGWVELPELGTNRSEVIAFIGALIRIYRGDWEGAVDLFKEVVRKTDVPSGLKIDSYLYMIRARAELGERADQEIAAVKTMAAPSVRAVQYIAMHTVQSCFDTVGRRARPPCRAEDLRLLVDLVEKTRPLFAGRDPWILDVDRALRGRSTVVPR